MKRKGFTLIEFLVYLSLLMMLSYLLFTFVSNTAQQILRGGKFTTRQAQALLAFDLFIRDIRAAPSECGAWTLIQLHECIWYGAMQDYDIGWSVKDDRLLRTTGRYNKITKTWQGKRSELVVRGVKAVMFEVAQSSGRIHALQCTLELQGEREPYTLKQWITIRERVV